MQKAKRRFFYPIIVAAIVMLLVPFAGNDAYAQFGAYFQLPQNDFTWTWGERRNSRGFADISVNGTDQGFRCSLEAKLSVNSRITRMDVRSIENEMRSAMSFVQTASYSMNDLDARRQIDWAVLECEKPQRREREEKDEEN